MDMRTFFIINLVICIFAFLINLSAAVILWKRRPLKSFQFMLMNIVLLNALYALNEMSTAAIFFTYRDLFQNKAFLSFRNLKAELIVHLICSFVVFMTLQRVIATTKPLNYVIYVTNAKTRLGAVFIYCTVILALITCSFLIWEIGIDASVIDKTLSFLFIIESAFVIVCYILIICTIRFSIFHGSPVFSKRNKRMLKVAVIVSTSFVVSYTPIAFVLFLNVKSLTVFHIVLLLVWLDSFINPLVVISNSNNLLNQITSTKRTVQRVLSQKGLKQIKIRAEESVSNGSAIVQSL